MTGASSGLGAHFSRVLAGAGAASIVLAARRVEKLEGLQQELRTLHPECRTVVVDMDVANTQSIRTAFDRIEQEVPEGLNVLVNNAGIGGAQKFLDLSEADFDGILGVNLRGAVFVAKEAAANMLKHQVTNGSIVNIASIMALRPGNAHTSYCASKAGLRHASKCMATELFTKGIRVNCICPGYFVTEINETFLTSEAGQE